MTIYNYQADSPLHCGLMSDLVICKFRKVWSYMTLNVLTDHETRYHLTIQIKPNHTTEMQEEFATIDVIVVMVIVWASINK